MRLRGAAAVVTGASSGIGEALALELARRGASVVVAARREEPLRRLCERIGTGADRVVADVTRPGAGEEIVGACIERHGRLDVIVNNAGAGAADLLEDSSVDGLRALLEVNALGAAEVTLAACPHMRRAGGGRIAFVASQYGRLVLPWAGAYAVSKHALLAFADTLRLELEGSGVGVTTVCPANVETPLWEEVAERTGRSARMVGPVVELDRLVRATADAIAVGREEVYVPHQLHSLAVEQRVGTDAHRRLKERWLGAVECLPRALRGGGRAGVEG